MASILYPDGNSDHIQPKNGRHFQLEELQKIVGGCIEIIPTRDGRVMVINENGSPLDQNRRATFIANAPDCIMGTVLTCYSDEILLVSPSYVEQQAADFVAECDALGIVSLPD